MQTPNVQIATLADLLMIPEAERFHEILDGELLPKALPGGEHGVSQVRLGRAVGSYDRRRSDPRRPGGWWFATEPTIRLSLHEIVQPDLAGWRRECMPSQPSGYPITTRPDWVCEIQCDGDARRRDGLQKRRIYADHGIPHYWLLDTERQTLTVLELTERGYVEVLCAGKQESVCIAPFELEPVSVGFLLGEDEPGEDAHAGSRLGG
jgi:Uma2 family endonuclease